MTETTIELINDLVKKSLNKGADLADAVSFYSSDINSCVRNGKLETAEKSESKGFGLRVIVGKKKAIVSSTDISPKTLENLVQRAIDMAKSSPDDPYIAIADKEILATNIEELDLFDKNEYSSEYLQELAKQTEDAGLSVEGITNSEGASASCGASSVAIATSNGFCHEYKSTYSSLSLSLIAGCDTNMERDYDYSVACHMSDLKSAEQIGKEAANNTLKRLNPKQPKTGKVPVLFSKKVSKNIISSLVSAVNGSSVARGTSFLKDELENQIFSNNINIINDPFIKRGLGSRPYDAEGVKGEKLNLVENGRLKNWLLDIRSAKQLGLLTNGNASRRLASNPSPSASNVYLENGDNSFADLIKDIKSGFYVNETFGTGINLITGDYSQGASGFWIEDGEITYAVSELTIASNLQHIFKELVPANDLEFKYSINSPSFLVDSIMVAGA